MLLGTPKILVVDDEGEICEFTKSFLSKRNYVVFTAQNQSDALDIVKKESPHIVLLDVRLGSENGVDVLRQIKQVDKNIKVIMVTAFDDEASKKEAAKLGADEYIVKPFVSGTLIDILLKKISDVSLK